MSNKILIAPVIGLIVMVSMMLISSSNVKSAEKNLEQNENIMYDLQNQLDIKKITNDDVEKKYIRDTTGLDVNRVQTDTELIESLMNKIFTWASHDEYEAARTLMSEKHGVPVDGYMLTELFPADITTIDADGTVYSYIDAYHRNSQFENMELYVTEIKNAIYSYYAFVEFSSSDSEGNEATGNVVMTFDVDTEGNINNLHGYTIN